MTVDPHPWAKELSTLYDHAWHRLIRGVHDRHAAARRWTPSVSAAASTRSSGQRPNSTARPAGNAVLLVHIQQ